MKEGADQVKETEVFPEVAERDRGELEIVYGVTEVFEAVEITELPAALDATILKIYRFPLIKLEIVVFKVEPVRATILVVLYVIL